MAKSNIKKASGPQQAFDCICVTDVRIFPLTNIDLSFFPFIERRMKALVEIVLNDQFVVRGLRIMEGENGLYIAYPTDHFVNGEDGQQRSTVFPITKALRDHVESVVLEKYQDTINNEKVTIK